MPKESKNSVFAKLPQSIIQGDYVLQPIPNAFNNRISWWLSKKGWMVAMYCFSANTPKMLEEKSPHLEEYIRIFHDKFEATER